MCGSRTKAPLQIVSLQENRIYAITYQAQANHFKFRSQLQIKTKEVFLNPKPNMVFELSLWLWLSMSIKYKRWRGAALETYHLGTSLSSTSISPFPPSLKSQRTPLPCNAFQSWYADPYLKSQLNPVVASIVYCFLRRSSTATVTELAVCVCLCSKTREMREQKSA
jgi:hypothetical protein